MTDLNALNSDFRDLIQCLADANVDFLIVGAYALALHGVPRTTGDIDILVRPTADNAARVFAALDAFGAPLAANGVQAGDFAQPGNVYQIGLPPRRIDILTRITGVGFDEAWADKQSATLGSIEVFFLSRELFIKNKQATGRTKDLADVERLQDPRRR